MSDGIYSCPMESIGTTLHPFLRIDEIFPSVLRTETRHVRWNPFVSDGTPTISVLFTDGLPVFRWKADDVRWSLVDSIGQPNIPKDPFSLSYVRVDDAISILQYLGRGAFMAKTDLKSAFRLIPIHPGN